MRPGSFTVNEGIGLRLRRLVVFLEDDFEGVVEEGVATTALRALGLVGKVGVQGSSNVGAGRVDAIVGHVDHVFCVFVHGEVRPAIFTLQYPVVFVLGLFLIQDAAGVVSRCLDHPYAIDAVAVSVHNPHVDVMLAAIFAGAEPPHGE